MAGAFKSARVALDIRVIDTRTGRVVAATSVESQAKGFSAAGIGAGGSLVGGLGGFAKTPMETAIRDGIQKAVDFIVSSTPDSYYHQ